MSQVTAASSTPNPPLRDTMAKPNCMNRIVQWFRDDETPTIRKVVALILAALTLIGIGFLVGHPILAPLTGALPIAFWAGIEWSVLEHQEALMTPAEKALVTFARVENSNATIFEKMQAAVGGKAAYDQLPVLELDPTLSETGYIDWLEPEGLSSPVMKGMLTGRPFIAMKIKDKGVITFFQRYSDVPNNWVYGAYIMSKDFLSNFNSILNKKDRATIHQIVVLKNHPRFTLAE